MPLEKQIDYLVLSSGKKIEVPFDELIIFSTNINPEDLVDEAFLRRIPYKINVPDPPEGDFRKLFELMCPYYGIPYDEEMISYLIETRYRRNVPSAVASPGTSSIKSTTPPRMKAEPKLTPVMLDMAYKNLFAAMGKILAFKKASVGRGLLEEFAHGAVQDIAQAIHVVIAGLRATAGPGVYRLLGEAHLFGELIEAPLLFVPGNFLNFNLHRRNSFFLRCLTRLLASLKLYTIHL